MEGNTWEDNVERVHTSLDSLFQGGTKPRIIPSNQTWSGKEVYESVRHIGNLAQNYNGKIREIKHKDNPNFVLQFACDFYKEEPQTNDANFITLIGHTKYTWCYGCQIKVYLGGENIYYYDIRDLEETLKKRSNIGFRTVGYHSNKDEEGATSLTLDDICDGFEDGSIIDCLVSSNDINAFETALKEKSKQRTEDRKSLS